MSAIFCFCMAGEHVSRVGAGRLDPVNVFIEQNGGQPVWEYSLLEAESM